MSHNSLDMISKLVSFGVHIGDYINAQYYPNVVNSYIVGIRNSFFIIDLRKTVFYLKRALLFANYLSSKHGSFLFYHSYIHSFFNLKLIFFYLITMKSDQSYVNYKWIPGLISNYKRCFIRVIYKFFDISVVYNRGRGRSRSRHNTIKKVGLLAFSKAYRNSFFRYLFLKILLLSHEKSKLKRDWLSEFNKVLSFWKVFVFLRSFKHIFNIPDCLIAINPSNNWFPICEFSKSKKVPVIGVLDTGSSQYGITYPIPSNDDSIAIGLFYISLFVNICLYNEILLLKKKN